MHQDSPGGRDLFQRLQAVTAIDPAYVQSGCAEWFWERQVNSYVLQVEPESQAYGDRAVVDYAAARRLEQVSDAFFAAIRHLIQDPVGAGHRPAPRACLCAHWGRWREALDTCPYSGIDMVRAWLFVRARGEGEHPPQRLPLLDILCR